MKIHKLLLIFLVLHLCSCSTTEIYSFKYIKRSPVEEKFTISKSKSSRSDKFQEYRWSTLIFISNNYGGFNHLALPAEFCEVSDEISHAKLTTELRGHPLVWFDQTWTFEGECHE